MNGSERQEEDRPLSSLLSYIRPPFPNREIGVTPSIKPYLLASIIKSYMGSAVIITQTSAKAEQLAEDISCFIKALFFPEGDDPESFSLRRSILHKLIKKEGFVAVFSLSSFTNPLPNREDFCKEEMVLRVGQREDLERLSKRLSDMGYVRRKRCEEEGEAAFRGGIVDVWSIGSDHPIRCELTEDRILSLRRFDPGSQLSFAQEREVVIQPYKEKAPFCSTIFEYIDKETPIFLDEPDILAEEASKIGILWENIERNLKRRELFSIKLLRENPLPSSAPFKFYGNLDLFLKTVRECQKKGDKVVIVARYSRQARRIEDLLASEDVVANTVVAPLHRGFAVDDLCVITCDDIFGSSPYRPLKRERRGFLRSISEIEAGDLLVHINYGIGRYQGMRVMEVEQRLREFLVLEYADGDKLYVPVDRMDRVERYIGPPNPKITRLRDGSWERIKRRVRRSCESFAKELISLHAIRSVFPKRRFSKDTLWQVQLEASFPYEETEDQLKAIEDVKRDMESPEPMDRLVLGDTGFGKTEIAVRAAFKAVADSAQVALIAPTTILVQQHYNTFCERMSRFPVNIEQLSRFRTKKECEEVIRGLANGDVDIVIGTHRLLSKDISFSNLGLVIIDEEQRFGVRQKERLKRFRETVDVLSITATPIPRTLYLSLSGIRKMSFINTPPIGRQPIVTEVAVFTPSLVKSAILKELKRDGQVFFVHNSIETIEEIKNLLLEIVPGIRLEIAHGRMKTSELEEVMLRFIEGEADLLLSTSIIESGLDFPRVNTIIINNAHQFGLADLYQLRGRVGRSYIKAYAYLLYPKDIRMTPEMAERLSAIYEFCELGSGIRLAMRDLQIRGAGNLLGPEQHGNITAVGLELYTRMLAEAVDALKGGSDRAPSSVYIDLPVDAYIPQEFIDDSAERFEFYKRLACGEDPDKIYQEMRDRFGVPPASVDNLIEIHRIRKMTEEIGIREVKVQGDHILLSLPQALSDKAERVADSFGLQFSSCRLKIKRCSLYELAKIVRGLC